MLSSPPLHQHIHTPGMASVGEIRKITALIIMTITYCVLCARITSEHFIYTNSALPPLPIPWMVSYPTLDTEILQAVIYG